MTTELHSGYGKEIIAARGDDWREDTTGYEAIGEALLHDVRRALSSVPEGAYSVKEPTDGGLEAMVAFTMNDDDGAFSIIVERSRRSSVEEGEEYLPELEWWDVTKNGTFIQHGSSDQDESNIGRIGDPGMNDVLRRALAYAEGAAETYRHELEVSLQGED